MTSSTPDTYYLSPENKEMNCLMFARQPVIPKSVVLIYLRAMNSKKAYEAQ